MPDRPPASASTPRIWLPLLAFGISVVGLILSGLHTYRGQRDQSHAHVEAQLRAIGELRIDQITRWLAENRANVRFFSQNSIVTNNAAAWADGGFRNPAQAAAIRQRIADFQNVFGYSAISLFDRDGIPRLNDRVDSRLTAAHLAEHRGDALRAMQSGEIVLIDFHHHGDETQAPMLGLIAPLITGYGNTARTVGAFYIAVPGHTTLFPLLAHWPTPSASGETVLARPQGDRAQFLFASRASATPPDMDITTPQNRLSLGARMLQGELGIIQAGRDYRGRPVLAYGNRVPGTPWLLVAKQDQDEVDAPVLRLASLTSLITTLLIFASGLVIWLWWRAQRQRQQVQLLGKDVERRVLQRRYDTLSRYASDVILLLDADGRILEINERVLDMYGYTPRELHGESASVLRPPETRANFAQNHAEILAAGYLEYETLHQRKDGSRFPVQVNARVIELQGLQHCHLLIRDISERVQAEEGLRQAASARHDLQAELEHQSRHHPLTGLPNMHWLLARLDQAGAESAGEDQPAARLALLVLNIDRFAQLNDNLGRATGDQVLIALARRWADLLDEACQLTHLSADQFAVLLPVDKAPDAAIETAARLLDSMRQPVPLDAGDKTVSLSLSIGVAIYPDDAREGSALLNAAEDAMRGAKAEKGNRVHFYDHKQAQRVSEWFKTENALRGALERNEFFLAWQPQIDTMSGRIDAVEALLRWRQGEEVVMPGRFIHIVEGTDLAEPVSRWVLAAACRQARQWLDRQRPLRVAVNIFSAHVTSGHLLDDVARALADSGLPAQLLELEVVESSLLAKPEVAARTLRELKRMGVGLALDDFGTGYSSLGYLKHYPFDVLKIDQLFTRNVNRAPEDAAIVRATISLAHNLGMRVLAEGVETASQLRFLARYRCDQLQGYLLSRPTTPDTVETDVMQRRDLRPAEVFESLPALGILLLEDDPIEVAILSELLQDAGYRVHAASTMQDAIKLIGEQAIDLIIADYYLNDTTGVEILRQIRRLYPETPAIMLSGASEQSVVLEALNRAAIRAFLNKPVQPEELLRTLHDVLGEHAQDAA